MSNNPDIREYLSNMTIPELGEISFATDFNAFCVAIKDNINKIVSAPFLKGDRGSAIKLQSEPLVEQIEQHWHWTEFAKELFRVIYTNRDGSEQSGYPLPLLYMENENDNLIRNGDDRWDEMVEIDGGCTIQSDDIHYSYDCFLQILEDQEWTKLNEMIWVGYDEATGTKFFWTPFWFFDSRPAHLKEMENRENLSGFRDMSCAVWGKYENHQWNFNVKKLIPTLYWDDSVNQFCWNIFGERTGIIAQGIQGDPGQSAKIWMCDGTVYDNIIKIDNVLYPQAQGRISDINAGDVALVIYKTSDPGGDFSDMMFGTVHIDQNDDRYILITETNLPIIKTTRNYSLRDYLDSIGTESESYAGDGSDIPGWSKMLYTRENPSVDSDTPVMGMWAKSDGNHYISPETYESTYQSPDATANPISGKKLNILYDKVYIPGSLTINEDLDTNNFNTKSLSVEENSTFNNPPTILIDGSYSTQSQYVLCSLFNVKGIQPGNGRRMRHGNNDFQYNHDVPIIMSCELILGWGKETMSHNGQYELYGAHKYDIEVIIVKNITYAMQPGIRFINGSDSSFTNELHIPLRNFIPGSSGDCVIEIDPDASYEEYIFEGTDGSYSQFPNYIRVMAGLTPNEIICYYKNQKGYIITKPIDCITNPYTKAWTEQYRLTGIMSIRFSYEGQEYSTMLMDFYGNHQPVPSGSANTMEVISKIYPLIDDKFSFFGTLTDINGNYILKTEPDILRNQIILNSDLNNQQTNSLKHLNDSFSITYDSSDYGTVFLKYRDNYQGQQTVDELDFEPVISPIKVYPAGINGMTW